ncbi:hypothetical protein ES703_122449 [subsurface metagenome]
MGVGGTVRNGVIPGAELTIAAGIHGRGTAPTISARSTTSVCPNVFVGPQGHWIAMPTTFFVASVTLSASTLM